MKQSKDELTQERLKELLDYDPGTGEFRWKVKSSKHSSAKAGDVAGTFKQGYRQIKIDGKHYLAHRLAFLYVTGEMPNAGMHTDHINGIKDDNRWVNLRIVTPSVNSQNQRKARKDNRSTGIRNVKKRGSKYQVILDDKSFGTYDTLAEAQYVAVTMKRIHHPGCTL